MSYEIVKAGNKQASRYREFIINSESDVSTLPTSTPNSDGEVAAPGSVAYTKDLSHAYMLGPDDVWREV